MKWKYAAAAVAVGTLALLGVAQARISEAARRAKTIATLERSLNDRLDEMTSPAGHLLAGGDVLAQADETRRDPFFPPPEFPQEAPASPPVEAQPSPPSPAPSQALDTLPPLPMPRAEDSPSIPPANAAPGDLPGGEAPLPKLDAEPGLRVESRPAQEHRVQDPGVDLLPSPGRPAPSREMPMDRRPSSPSPREALPGVARPSSRLRWSSPFDEDARPVSPTGDGPVDDQARSLVRQLVEAEARGASGPARKVDQSEQDLAYLLKARLDNEFGDRQRRYAAEVDALEERVKKLREMIQKREENRDQIIDRRLQQLKVEALGMGW